MSDHFVDLAARLLDKEGGYTNDPADAGGETNWGVTVAVARAFGYAGAMRAMTRDQALGIYVARYYVQPGFAGLDAIDRPIADRLFDIGVNMGPSTGVKFLQRALNVLNQQGADYPDLVVDGGLGAITLAALRAFIARRRPDGGRILLGMIAAQHSVRYIEIAEGAPPQERYEYGWQAQRALATA